MKRYHPKKMISAYIDGELNLKAREQILNHLQECSSCNEFYHALKATRSLCLETNEYPTSPYFVKKVMAHYQSRKRVTFWNSFDFLSRPIMNGIFIVSIIILIVLLFPHNPITYTDEFAYDTDYRVVLEDSIIVETLNTHEQALLFALENSWEITDGEMQ